MKIGVIGAGNVGGTLGGRWAQNGHDVVFGVRNPDSSARGALGRLATLAGAAEHGDVILLATPWPAAQEALESMGDLSGKIVIDALNPLLGDLSGLALGTTTSAGEQVAEWAKGARVVKAFNTVGYNVMADPLFDGKAAVMFYCGDDARAKETVRSLVAELGFDAKDAGPLRQARVLEPFAMLWISLAYAAGYGREMAFQMMRR